MSRLIVSPLVRSGLLRPKGIKPAVEAGGISLNGSITFDGSNEFLSRVLSTSGASTTIATYSVWIKRASGATSFHVIFSVESESFEPVALLDGGDAQVLFLDNSSPNWGEGVGVFPASETWEHWLFRYDSTQGTADDRIRIYRDGSLQTDFVVVNEPSLNDAHGMFVDGSTHRIGNDSMSAFFEGKLSDLIVVEGQSLAPDNFGFDDGGTWKWKDYEGVFGDHGFRINPQDSSEIGTDQSGNGNDFTLNNMGTGNFDSGDTPPT